MHDLQLKERRILVVDDEPDVLETAEDILEDLFGEIACFGTYEAAYAALEAGGFDAAIVDLMGVRGLELLDAFGQKVPCLVLTGHAVSPEALRQAIERKAVAYIPKDEIAELPRYLRIVLSAPPSLNLWQVWLHPGLDYMNLRTHLGADFDRTDPDFFEGVLYGARPHETFAEVIEHPDGIFEVRHKDPPQNLLTPGTIFGYQKLLNRLRQEPTCRAVVQTSGLPPGVPPQVVEMIRRRAPFRWFPRGAGKTLARAALRLLRPGLGRSVFFCGGIPLDTSLMPDLLQAILEFGKDAYLDIFTYQKPIVMVLEGGAVAGGAEFALCGHYLVGDRNAALWLPELRLGFIPPAGIPLLINRVGVQRAFAICADARLVSARRAYRLGIIDRLVPVGQGKSVGIRVARKLADRQAVAGLHLARNLVGFDMKQALEASFREWKRLLDTPAAQAKVKRFLEERGREVSERVRETAS